MSTTAPERRTPRFADSVGLVAGREIVTRVRSKSFIISTIILMVAVLASIILGSVLSGTGESAPKVAAIGSSASSVAEKAGFELETASDQAAAETMLRDGDIDAIIVDAPSDPTGVSVIGLDSTPSNVVQSLAIVPSVELLNPDAPNPFLIYIVALGFGIVFFMSAITFGGTIAQSVVEEKQTRVVEILLSTVSARSLLTGKVLGNSAMAFGQIVAIAGLALVGLVVTGQRVLLGGLGSSVIWFVVFFAIGFVMLAALFAATAALVSRAEDVQSATSPVTMLVMAPYILIIVFNNNPTVLSIMSYVPFSAPVGMPMRIFLGTAEWWEPLLSLAILIATTAVVILIGERIYSNSLLRMGARVKLSEAIKG
ncbi:ABC transporter permease [Agromyces atrinae]|uniref:ABC transporter permease n=1 Tax=Agromyces atrinae TaxID=592376 RepID=A0A4Q2MF93_9MICO|nr:ABC transporter permease [Agromyces atrinae]NYD68026.1 ABC-2 type transport system permease protein [Agromyces atrinae]RXZ87820.1 ABC transporter permease [Agromyces atrinae]